MKTYLGVKIVQAEPMMRHDCYKEEGGIYATSSGKVLPNEEGYKVVYKDGYTSWCPKEQFEEANDELPEEPNLRVAVVINLIKRMGKADLALVMKELDAFIAELDRKESGGITLADLPFDLKR